MALVLLGEGRAWYGDELLPGAEALARIGESPAQLACKEGLSLTNGTHSVTAIAVLAAHDAGVAATTADVAASLSVQALRVRSAPTTPGSRSGSGTPSRPPSPRTCGG